MPLPKLKGMYRCEPPSKSRDRLQVAVLRTRGRMLEEIVNIVRRNSSTVHRWLHRMERESQMAGMYPPCLFSRNYTRQIILSNMLEYEYAHHPYRPNR